MYFVKLIIIGLCLINLNALSVYRSVYFITCLGIST